jgi:host factor-I protein
MMSTVNEATLQDRFLNILSSQKIPLAVYLMSGIKLQGTIASFDDAVILLEHDQVAQMIYKHSVSTIVPSKLVDLPK